MWTPTTIFQGGRHSSQQSCLSPNQLFLGQETTFHLTKNCSYDRLWPPRTKSLHSSSQSLHNFFIILNVGMFVYYSKPSGQLCYSIGRIRTYNRSTVRLRMVGLGQAILEMGLWHSLRNVCGSFRNFVHNSK